MQLVGFIMFLVGGAITLTLIGAIVGIPLALFGIFRVMKGRNLTVESSYRGW